jgi:hypothetical protein
MTRCTITFRGPSAVRYEVRWSVGAAQQTKGYDYELPQGPLLLQTIRWLVHLLVVSPRDAQQWHFHKVIGENLFELAFPVGSQRSDEMRNECEAARNNFVNFAQQGRMSIDLYFEHDAGLWAGLPWEFLYVPADGGASGFFLADPDKEVRLSRRLRPPSAEGLSPLPLKVLVAVSNPTGNRPVVVRQPLKEYLEDLRARCSDKIITRFVPEDADFDTLKACIGEFEPDVFHFRGHGERGGLWLTAAPEAVAKERDRISEEHEKGNFSPDGFDAGVLIPREGVLQLFATHRPRLLILEACHSGAIDLLPGASAWASVESLALPITAERLLTQVPAVVAMQYTIHIDTAAGFVEDVYEGIVQGKDVDEAVSTARQKLTRAGTGTTFTDRSFGAPVVYLGSQGPLCSRLLPGTLTRCPDCGHANAPQSYCGECQRRLNLTCPKPGCNEKNGVEDLDHPPRLCWKCETALQPPGESTSDFGPSRGSRIQVQLS